MIVEHCIPNDLVLLDGIMQLIMDTLYLVSKTYEKKYKDVNERIQLVVPVSGYINPSYW